MSTSECRENNQNIVFSEKAHMILSSKQRKHRHLSENPTMSWYCPQINQNIDIFRKSPHDIVLKPSKTSKFAENPHDIVLKSTQT